jgi:hypothetical protein
MDLLLLRNVLMSLSKSANLHLALVDLHVLLTDTRRLLRTYLLAMKVQVPTYKISERWFGGHTSH